MLCLLEIAKVCSSKSTVQVKRCNLIFSKKGTMLAKPNFKSHIARRLFELHTIKNSNGYLDPPGNGKAVSFLDRIIFLNCRFGNVALDNSEI